ncbi:MFS transporter [Bauldia litoralis]|uniref:MFS transporter n=1 Tax=Bauldia litoralis TaxID=665467 RepID=UPI000B86EB52
MRVGRIIEHGATRPTKRSAILGWLLFDCATQPFFTLVITFVFAPYFAAHLAATPVEGQALWGYATGTAGLIIAVSSPLLGAIADATGARKPWIAGFSVLLVVGSIGLWWAAPGVEGAIAIALVAFVVATIGAEFATVFNNAMMPDLVDADQLGRLSGTGWAVGYAGGLVSIVISLGLMIGDPATGKTLFGTTPILGLDPASFGGDRASGPFSAIWYVVFVLPLFLFVPDTPKRLALLPAIRYGFRDLAATVAHLGRHANAARYLLARMIYADGLVALFAFGAIYAAGTFGWSSIELGLFGILILVTGTIGAAVGGRIDDHIGPKRLILGCIVILALASLGILSVDTGHIGFIIPVDPGGGGLFGSASEKAYLVLGATIGAIAGPLQSASRTLLVRISPPGQMTQFFGLYALSGKVTSFAGPLAVGALTAYSGSQRIGISVLLVFFVAGGAVLMTVRED